MQDRYAGDFGDFVKLALLNELGAGSKLGVAWYRTPDESHNGDGRHIGYLDPNKEGQWRALAPSIYDGLRQLVQTDGRSVERLQPLLPFGTIFHSDVLISPKTRSVWFAPLRELFDDRDIIFADPDNGITPPSYRTNSIKSIKSITMDEIWRLRSRLQTLIIYHHQSRFRGGHDEEIQHIGNELAKMHSWGSVFAIRAKNYSPRVFFIIYPTFQIWERAEAFAEKWAGYVTFHDITGKPDGNGFPPSNPYSSTAETLVMDYGDYLRDRRLGLQT